ncbi:MAG: DNA primase [Coriobacteriia bacterium]|nr:DNA primase [Coriobacteriia bacterium]
MARIADEDINAVREASDLLAVAAETVVLKQRGGEFWGNCPFHDEKTPSFKINPQTQLWHCFGCSQGGDIFKYIMMRENLDFVDSVRYLAERAHIELHEAQGAARSKGTSRQRLMAVLKASMDFYHLQLLKNSDSKIDEARNYLSTRGFGLEVCKRYYLGYAPGNNALTSYLTQQGFSAQEMIEANVAIRSKGSIRDRFYHRIMFPIFDEFSNPIAFGGRIVGAGEPKYLNSQETKIFHKGKNLYALDLAKAAIVEHSEVLVVEGYTDVIALHEAGITNVVATLGTAMTEKHVKVLSRFAKRIVLLFDGDRAGQNAAQRVLQYINQTKSDFFAVLLPDNLDPADFLKTHEVDEFKEAIQAAQPLLRFVIDRQLERFNLSVLEERSRALDEVSETLAIVKGTLLADDYALYLANILNADVQTVKRTIAQAKVPPSLAASSVQDTKDDIQSMQADDKQEDSKKKALSLSADEAHMLTSERELLALIASYPKEMAAFSGRIKSLHWFSTLNKNIAQAMLDLGADAQSQDLLAAALSVHEQADKILSATKLMSNADLGVDQTAEFLLDDLLRLGLARDIRIKRTQLKHPEGMSAQAYDDLFEELTYLQGELRLIEEKMLKASKSV